MQKTLNYSIHSSKKHRQYESNKVNKTATKHSLCPGNGVCLTLTRLRATQGSHLFREMHHICNFVRLSFNNNKDTTLKKHKKNRKIKKKQKTCFLNFYKKHKKCFYIYDAYIRIN